MAAVRSAAVPGLLLALAAGLPAQERPPLTLATTTSVRDAGLLDVLLPPFERRTGYAVKVIAVGSGQAIELGRRGQADILILHAPAAEAKLLADGFGIDRRPLMHNEFVVVGPAADPAGLSGGADAVAAFRTIAAAGALFVSRGDGSGTHIKEDTLWRRAGIRPERRWYRESGQGMSATLQIANELRAYTLSDIATYLSHRSPLDLAVLVEGDTALYNPYHVVRVNPERFGWINVLGARALADFLVSAEAQAAIAAFGRERFRRSIFVPDAGREAGEAGEAEGGAPAPES